MTIRIVQMSDMHLFADPAEALLGVNTSDSFNAVLNKVLQEEHATQLILLTGDLSQDHSEVAYSNLADMIKILRVPAYYVPGNHDDVSLLRKVFPRGSILNDKQIIVENWQIILLNSQVPGAPEGLLDASQLIFLQDCLKAYPNHYAVIVFHHPPFFVGCEWLDNIGLINADVFWECVLDNANVRTVLCGHVHQECTRDVGNIKCYSTPSTCFQFMRNQNEFGLEKLPPGYRWLELYEDGRVNTGVNRVDDYIGNYDENAKGY